MDLDINRNDINSMYALINSYCIYTGKKILYDHALIISDSIIVNICPMNKLLENIKKYDFFGLIITPGFIDLQINGCGGVQFNDHIESISIQTLEKMKKTNQYSGCTSFLPTLITSSDPLIKQAVQVIRNFLKKNKNQVLGLHLEGPFLNPIKKGIHNDLWIRSPSEEIINYICNNSDIIKKITLAPEQLNQIFVKQLKNSGICVSVGHSNANYMQTKLSFESGINFGTHLFNAMSSISARDPGVVGAILDTPEIYCSIIADGIHVHWANIRLAKEIKKNRLILISDGLLPTKMKNITNFVFAGKTIHCKQGVCLDEKGILSGSTLTMMQAIKNIVKNTDIPLDEAIRMATLYPAKAINIEHNLGSIEINKIANLTAFTQDFKIKKTIVNGKIII